VLETGTIGFRESGAGEVEGLSAIELHATNRSRSGEQLPLGGVEIRLR